MRFICHRLKANYSYISDVRAVQERVERICKEGGKETTEGGEVNEESKPHR